VEERCLDDSAADEADDKALVVFEAGVVMGVLTEAASGREDEEAEIKLLGQGGGKDPKAWLTLSLEIWEGTRLREELV